jgi:S1-C subfamily serine protease
MRRAPLVAGLICLAGLVGAPCHADTATGTGFVVNADGYLLTCHHVIEDAAKIEVAIGGNTYLGTVIGDDKDHDLALLEIKAKGLVPLALANSNKVEVGAEVRASGGSRCRVASVRM